MRAIREIRGSLRSGDPVDLVRAKLLVEGDPVDLFHSTLDAEDEPVDLFHSNLDAEDDPVDLAHAKLNAEGDPVDLAHANLNAEGDLVDLLARWLYCGPRFSQVTDATILPGCILYDGVARASGRVQRFLRMEGEPPGCPWARVNGPAPREFKARGRDVPR